MTSRLFLLDLSDHLGSLIEAEVECYVSFDHFVYQVTDYIATRIPSLNILGSKTRPSSGEGSTYTSA